VSTTQRYEAVLHGDTVEWKGARPNVTVGRPLPIQIVVTTLEDSEQEEAARRVRLREALEQLAKLDPFREIPDAAEWQRKIRKDRPLPGREE
jgi:hypothetical protein